MKPIKLGELRPQFGEFTLEATHDHKHRLRKISIDDYEWIEATFGLPLNELFAEGKEVKLSTVTRLIYHQLEDKSLFRAEDRTIIDDEGEERVQRISGLQKFREAIVDPSEAANLTKAYLKSIGLSQPLALETNSEKPSKKKVKPLAGPKSSTP